MTYVVRKPVESIISKLPSVQVDRVEDPDFIFEDHETEYKKDFIPIEYIGEFKEEVLFGVPKGSKLFRGKIVESKVDKVRKCYVDAKNQIVAYSCEIDVKSKEIESEREGYFIEEYDGQRAEVLIRNIEEIRKYLK